MKFLIDAQLPPKLCDLFKASGIDSIHINSLLNGDETKDSEIISFADEENYIIITKDIDFYHSHMLNKKPSKLLLVTTGNIKNRDLFEMININLEVIVRLFKTCEYIEVSNSGIIGHTS